MAPARDDGARTMPELRSELLRAQLRRWTDQVASVGKASELFELEMWLRSFERFFRIGSRLSERETRALALRNWSEDLRLVDNALMRVVHLATSILSEEQVDLTRFDRYVEGSLANDESLDPYIEKLVRHTTPETALTLLKESFEDLHLVLVDLVRLSRLPYATFLAVGKIVYREVRRSALVALIIDKKFKPVHDRIRNKRVSRLIREIPDPGERRQAAKVFLELFRLLHYLEYTDPARLPEDQLRDTILPFALVTSETRLLLGYIEKRVLKGADLSRPVDQVYDSFVYCVPLELRKVINNELADVSVTRQAESVRTRVENSHGILKDCFQQSIVQLAQAFDAARGRGAHLPGLHRAARAVGEGARRPHRGGARGARLPGGQGRGHGRPDEGDDLGVLRPPHQVPDVPGLVGVRALLHRDPEVRQHERARPDRPPVRDIPRHPPPRGPEALDPAGRGTGGPRRARAARPVTAGLRRAGPFLLHSPAER